MTMNPRVTNVVPLPDHMLELTFSNGEVKHFNVHPLLDTGIFAELKDEALFMTAKAALGTVVWDNGAVRYVSDLCPDTLYLDAEVMAER